MSRSDPRTLARTIFVTRRDNGKGRPRDPFVTTPRDVVHEMLKLAGVRPDETVYDLGCGDGRIAIAAALEYGAYGVGVELRRSLVKRARDKAAELGVAEKVTIIQKDFQKVDLADANALALYLTTETLGGLEKKFRKELRPGARIAAWVYPIDGWSPTKVVRFKSSELVGESLIYLYVV